MLLQVAQTYDREVEVAIRKALALLQPVMIVVMAAVIGFMADIDGLPETSQKPGVAYHAPLIENGPGHGEGHNAVYGDRADSPALPCRGLPTIAAPCLKTAPRSPCRICPDRA